MGIPRVLVLGGGVAGLAAFRSLRQSGMVKVEGVEEKSLGGLLRQGGAKFSRYPAGKRTAEYVGYDFYVQKELELYELWGNLLQDNSTASHVDCKGLDRKIYHTYLMCGQCEEYVDRLLPDALALGLYIEDSVVGISRTHGGYRVNFLKSNTKEYDAIIVASGRSGKILDLLSRIGQKFEFSDRGVIGCRAVFDAATAVPVELAQLDFKLKGPEGYQTYCYNYRGRMVFYNANGMAVVSGCIDAVGSQGNVVIGRKMAVSRTLLERVCAGPRSVKSLEEVSSWLDSVGLTGLSTFSERVASVLGVMFTEFHFPALEQFWLCPCMGDLLDSHVLKNIYFAGDASGVSNGFVQSYVTGCFAAQNCLERICGL